MPGHESAPARNGCVLICSGALTMQLSGQIEQETEAHTEVMSAEVADLIFCFSTGFFSFFFTINLVLSQVSSCSGSGFKSCD